MLGTNPSCETMIRYSPAGMSGIANRPSTVAVSFVTSLPRPFSKITVARGTGMDDPAATTTPSMEPGACRPASGSINPRSIPANGVTHRFIVISGAILKYRFSEDSEKLHCCHQTFLYFISKAKKGSSRYESPRLVQEFADAVDVGNWLKKPCGRTSCRRGISEGARTD